MFGKSSKWWFGENSIFGQAVNQTKWGQGGEGTNINVPTDIGLDKETQTLIIAAVVALVLFK